MEGMEDPKGSLAFDLDDLSPRNRALFALLVVDTVVSNAAMTTALATSGEQEVFLGQLRNSLRDVAWYDPSNARERFDYLDAQFEALTYDVQHLNRVLDAHRYLLETFRTILSDVEWTTEPLSEVVQGLPIPAHVERLLQAVWNALVTNFGDRDAPRKWWDDVWSLSASRLEMDSPESHALLQRASEAVQLTDVVHAEMTTIAPTHGPLEHSEFTFYIDPGNASAQDLREVLAAINALHRAAGGAGFVFSVEGERLAAEAVEA
jgi:hypothetical protein